MAYIVRNSSGVVGSAKIDSDWVTLHPGDMLSVAERPSSVTYNVQVTFMDDSASVKVTNKKEEKVAGKKGGKVNTSSLPDNTSIGTEVVGSSDTATLDFN